MADITLKYVEYIKCSEKALLVRWQNKEVWFPLTQITSVPESFPAIGLPHVATDFVISEWIANQKGITEAGFITAKSTEDSVTQALLDRIKVLEQQYAAAKSSQSASDRRLAEATQRALIAESG